MTELRQSIPESLRTILMQNQRCYGCYRPIDRCFCANIPCIENKTRVLILQHMRERFHPFNTARIVRRALANSELIAQHSSQLIATLSTLDLSFSTGLLYPGIHARSLDTLTPSEQPKQLVILDGTWHHAKTLIRDIPILQSLPRYSFVSTAPSRYRIRREPNLAFLSTLEATVTALLCLEPETLGLNSLLAAFDLMIDNQLASPMSDYGARRNHRRPLSCYGVPKIIRDHLEKIVVVYGETTPGLQLETIHSDHHAIPCDNQSPCYLVAERLVTGERFASAVRPGVLLSPTFLGHLDLPESVFLNAPALDQVGQAWRSFLRSDDTLAFYYSNIPKLLAQLACDAFPMIHLKSVRMMASKNKSLEHVLSDLNVQPAQNSLAGRAGKRLASTLALVQHLHASAKQSH